LEKKTKGGRGEKDGGYKRRDVSTVGSNMAVFNQQFNSSLLPSIFAHVIAEFVIVTSLTSCRHNFNFRPLMWDLWWTK